MVVEPGLAPERQSTTQCRADLVRSLSEASSVLRVVQGSEATAANSRIDGARAIEA